MHKKSFKFKNGDEVKEKVTGYAGIITGTCFYLTGCNQYLITSKVKDEFSEPKAVWYDEGRLDLVHEQKVSEEEVKAVDNGCDLAPTMGVRGY